MNRKAVAEQLCFAARELSAGSQYGTPEFWQEKWEKQLSQWLGLRRKVETAKKLDGMDWVYRNDRLRTEYRDLTSSMRTTLMMARQSGATVNVPPDFGKDAM